MVVEGEVINIASGRFGLGSYIALDHQYRENLLFVTDTIKEYLISQNKQNLRPLNFYIEAPPGSGKSFLVKQMVETVSRYLELTERPPISYLYFNLSGAENASLILALFKEIQSSNIDGKIPIVFIDEIDTQLLNRTHFFRSFLVPMFDGAFYDKGRKYSLGPSIFFFAGSKKIYNIKADNGSNQIANNSLRESIKEVEDKKKLDQMECSQWLEKMNDILALLRLEWKSRASGYPDKLPDFLDRIDRVMFIPPLYVLPDGLLDLEKTQAVLVASSMIKNRFHDVDVVEDKVISLLCKILLNNESKRLAESIIMTTAPPINGKLSLNNLPPHVLKSEEGLLGKKVTTTKIEWLRIVADLYSCGV